MKKNNKSNFSKFILLWAGELISGVGGGLTSFGLGVYVFQKTGSAASMALVTLLAFLPTLLFSVPAGVLADRYDRRLLMMIGDGCSALGIFYILVCMRSGEAALYHRRVRERCLFGFAGAGLPRDGDGFAHERGVFQGRWHGKYRRKRKISDISGSCGSVAGGQRYEAAASH